MPAESNSNYELLSAYIDDMLSNEERITLEQQLADTPALKAELNQLRQTVAFINQLPALKAPRNFTLTEAMLKKDQPSKRIINFPQQGYSMVLMGAAASFVLIAVFFILFLSTQSFNETNTTDGMAQNSQPESTLMVAIASTPTALSSPEIETMTGIHKESENAVGAEENAHTEQQGMDSAVESVPQDAPSSLFMLPLPSPDAASEGAFPAPQDMTAIEEISQFAMPTFSPDAAAFAAPQEDTIDNAIETAVQSQLYDDTTATSSIDAAILSEIHDAADAPPEASIGAASMAMETAIQESEQTEVPEAERAATTDDESSIITALPTQMADNVENVARDSTGDNNTLLIAILIIIFSGGLVFIGFRVFRKR